MKSKSTASSNYLSFFPPATHVSPLHSSSFSFQSLSFSCTSSHLSSSYVSVLDSCREKKKKKYGGMRVRATERATDTQSTKEGQRERRAKQSHPFLIKAEAQKFCGASWQPSGKPTRWQARLPLRIHPQLGNSHRLSSHAVWPLPSSPH